MRTRNDYCLLWANGMTFGEVYDLMKADLESESEPVGLSPEAPTPDNWDA